MGDRSVQRRLAAVLAADVAGYTRLMEQDTDGTVAAWQAAREEVIRPQVSEFSGKIVKLTGDGFLVEFPTVQDAVKCAIAMQEGLSGSILNFRMGVNLGDIVDDGEDIHGEGVNIAARIEALADEGGINISGMVYESIRNRIEAKYEDRGDHDVKNVSAPVRVYAIASEKSVAVSESVEKEITNKPSIAVLPFDNLSGDPEQDFVGDGLTEDIISGLSRIRSFFVIARNSTFQFKGTSPDIRRVAKELGVRYVLEGSVRKAGDRIRVTAQLIDAANNNQLWAERFDREFTDIFSVQDEITASILAQLEPELGQAEYERVKAEPPENLDAWELFNRAMILIPRLNVKAGEEARRLFEQAIERDPNFARAYAGIAWSYMIEVFQGDASLVREPTLRAGQRAVELDPKDAFSHIALGWGYGICGRSEEAIQELEECLRINPNSAQGHSWLGITLIHSGDAEEGIPHLEMAMRLSPADPFIGLTYQRLALAYLYLKEHDSAVKWALDAILKDAAYPAHLTLAAALAHLDRIDEAQTAVNKMIKKYPGLSIRLLTEQFPTSRRSYKDHLINGLRQAGLTESGPDVAPSQTTEATDKPSIAVLPFDNLSGDPEQEYFADGMAEDLITDLSKLSGLFVIARNSSFAFKGQLVDAKEISKKLAVGYVLEGSVRKVGTQVRINAQLIDASTGGHIWAERYDGDLVNIFSLQDEITKQIISALEVNLTAADQNRPERRPTDNLEAYDLFLRARGSMQPLSKLGFERAKSLLDRAVELDPSFAEPYALLSRIHLMSQVLSWSDDFDLQPAVDIARKAVTLDANSGLAHAYLGWVLIVNKEHDKGIAELERAIATEPNTADGHFYLSEALNYIGEPERAIEVANTALRLNPFYHSMHHGHSYYLLKRYDEALSKLNEYLASGSPHPITRLLMAATYSEMGQMEEASNEVSLALQMGPYLNMKVVDQTYPWRAGEVRNRIFQALRDAGMPEGEEETAPLPLPDKPSIAVLPFDNLSGDPEQEYFSDGMAEDLITDLSKISNLSVSARNSSFPFKGQMPDVREVADKLGVAFVLEGSVRKMGERLRINAQLISAADGNHLWAERYDGELAEIFDFQDRIRGEIVGALALKLTPRDVAQVDGRRTRNVEAYDLYLRGRERYFRYTKEALGEAIEALEKAIELDPAFGDAYGYLSYCYFNAIAFHGVDYDEYMNRAFETASKGVELNPDSAMAHTRLGWIQGFMRRFDDAFESFETALAINPDFAEACSYYGAILNFYGDPEKALPLCERTLQLDAFAPPSWEFHLAQSYYELGQPEEAAARLERVLARSPGFVPARRYLIASYADLGRLDDAGREVERLLELAPHYSVGVVDHVSPYGTDQARQRFLDALRKAGLPEDGDTQPAPALPDKPSIAVLPFDNLSGDPEQEYFSDGITEDIITALSRVRWFFVIARNSTQAYKGTSPDIRQVAQDLGVRYVLEGSVRKAGNRVRITAQLIDATTGNHIWAERYDRDLADIFAVQDEITETVAGSIEPGMALAERDRAKSKPADNVDAWDLYQRGMAYQWDRGQHGNLEGIRASQSMYEKAIELDPKFSLAYAQLAVLYNELLVWGLSEDRDSDMERGFDAANKAVQYDANDSMARLAIGSMHLAKREYDLAIPQFELAIDSNPSNAFAHFYLGKAHVWSDDPESAFPHAETSLRLSPRGPWVGANKVTRAECFLVRGEFEQALAAADEAMRHPNVVIYGPAIRASALGHLGKTGEAREAIAEMQKRRPAFDSCTRVAEGLAISGPKYLGIFLDGLRKAGLPDEPPERTSPPLPDKPSIAVLPFDDLSGDPEQEYFSDGITEDIITALSHFPWFFVIARNTTFTYKGQAVDVPAVTKDLGVRYVLEGSVRKAGNRVRITAQLIEGDTGNHVWAERYDRELEDIFAVQDNITESVTNAVAPELLAAEMRQARRGGAPKLDTWTQVMQAHSLINSYAPKDNAAAIIILEQVIESDPGSCIAHADLAMARLWSGLYGWSDDTRATYAAAMISAEAAVDLDGRDAWARTALGWNKVLSRQHEDAIRELELAIGLNPNLAIAHSVLGQAHGFSGEPESAVEQTQLAIQLSPRDPLLGVMYAGCGIACFAASDYEGTAKWSGQAGQHRPPFAAAYRMVAAALGNLGQIDDAKEAVQKFLAYAPGVTIEASVRQMPWKLPEHQEALAKGLKAAGMAES